MVSVPGEKGQVDLGRLMELLEAGISRESGRLTVFCWGRAGISNDSALQAGIVREVKAFIAPKIFGGGGRTPVEGTGVELPSEARRLRLDKITRIGGDLLLEYLAEGGDGTCLRE